MEETQGLLPRQTENPIEDGQQQISFTDVKARIREQIVSASRSFIAVGYYLKYIRDHRLYEEDGQENIWEFAYKEYGISKSTASRYMAMNDKFSEGGNSPEAAEKYREFGKSQLQEMLYLNDEQLEQVTPDAQIKQIRDIRTPVKDIPYYELPGQMSVYDFPDLLPEDQEDEVKLMDNTGIGSAVLALADFADNEPEETIAISQQGFITGTDLATGTDFSYLPDPTPGTDFVYLPDPIPENNISAEDAVMQLIELKEYCQAETGEEWGRITAALDLAIKILKEAYHD